MQVLIILGFRLKRSNVKKMLRESCGSVKKRCKLVVQNPES